MLMNVLNDCISYLSLFGLANRFHSTRVVFSHRFLFVIFSSHYVSEFVKFEVFLDMISTFSIHIVQDISAGLLANVCTTHQLCKLFSSVCIVNAVCSIDVVICLNYRRAEASF